MSKILRRPMFRGGPVDSYNTGIASGLGQPRIGAKRGRFFGDVGNPYTAPLLMDTASVLPPVTKTRSRIRGPKDFEESRAGTLSDAEGLLASNAVMNDATLNVPTYDFEQEDELVNVGDVELGLPTSKVEDLTTEKVVEKVKDGDDEVEVTMTDLEKALGLDKARRRDLGDMLGRASAAFLGAGDVREGLAEFMAAETKAGPSRTERIKSIAGLEEFKAKKAKELYESKLAATLKQKQGTKGSLQKDIEYLGTLSGADRIAALGKLGYKAPSLSAAIKELKITGQAPDAATIINLATLYEGPDFKGIVDVTEELSGKPAGTYITTDATALIIIDEQGNTRLQKL